MLNETFFFLDFVFFLFNAGFLFFTVILAYISCSLRSNGAIYTLSVRNRLAIIVMKITPITEFATIGYIEKSTYFVNRKKW